MPLCRPNRRCLIPFAKAQKRNSGMRWVGKLTEKRIRRGSFFSGDQLVEPIPPRARKAFHEAVLAEILDERSSRVEGAATRAG